MPRYLIHIGPHKTGTTYLQHGFTRLRPALAARGVLYPHRWGNGEHGHHDLPPALAQPDDGSLPAAFEVFNRSGAHAVLLSSETFTYASDAEVRRLHALLGGEPATVVFYARRWSELIPSCWRESVKHGSLVTLPEYVLACLADPTMSPIVNFCQVLDRYAAVFGAGSIRMVSYNGVLEADEDLLSHFCRAFLSWPDLPPIGLGRVNPSLDMVDSEIIRTLNTLEWTRARDGRQLLHERYLEAKAGLPVRWIIEKSMQFVVNTLRIDDAAPALAQLHRTIVKCYDSARVPPVAAVGLFEPRVADVKYVRPDYLMADGVLEVMRDMQATLSHGGESRNRLRLGPDRCHGHARRGCRRISNGRMIPTPTPQKPLIRNDTAQRSGQPAPTGKPLIAGTTSSPTSAAMIPRIRPHSHSGADSRGSTRAKTIPYRPPQKQRSRIRGTPNGAIGSVG